MLGTIIACCVCAGGFGGALSCWWGRAFSPPGRSPGAGWCMGSRRVMALAVRCSVRGCARFHPRVVARGQAVASGFTARRHWRCVVPFVDARVFTVHGVSPHGGIGGALARSWMCAFSRCMGSRRTAALAVRCSVRGCARFHGAWGLAARRHWRSVVPFVDVRVFTVHGVSPHGGIGGPLFRSWMRAFSRCMGFLGS